MHRSAPSYAGDSESLQADVMRFMAIIAFCLIAILALVRNTDPDPADPSIAEPQPVAVAVPERPVTPEPEPVPEVASSLTPAPVPAIELRTMAEVAEPAAGVSQEAEPDLPEPSAPPPAAAPEPAKETETAIAVESSPETEEEGLILRFASDGDFLRLIARGDIRVYAFQDSDVLALSESYRFLDTTAPGQVYELLPPSIPRLIVDALRQARPHTDGYRWGIALPGRISHQIERHLNQVSKGELVIDRYGDVHHVAAS